MRCVSLFFISKILLYGIQLRNAHRIEQAEKHIRKRKFIKKRKKVHVVAAGKRVGRWLQKRDLATGYRKETW